MNVKTKNGRQVNISKFNLADTESLADYFYHLSDESKKRYGPHPFDQQFIADLFSTHADYLGYIAREPGDDKIIAYSVIKLGFLPQDHDRLKSYGIFPDPETDATFAPSVADAWQSCGLGNKVFRFILPDLMQKGIRRIILWGGVQSTNDKAVGFYMKNGFRELGQFEHNGNNIDMMLEITETATPSASPVKSERSSG